MIRKMFLATAMAAAAVAAMPAAAHADASSTAPEPASETTGCKYGHWPAETQNRPASLEAGAAAGVYLWHADNGWHLFVTHPGNDKVEFKGSITSRGRIYGVAQDTERNDSVVSKSAHRVNFRFNNYGHLDGVHFRMACARGFTVNASVNGHRVPVDHIFIGRDGDHPLQNPFSIVRQK